MNRIEERIARYEQYWIDGRLLPDAENATMQAVYAQDKLIAVLVEAFKCGHMTQEQVEGQIAQSVWAVEKAVRQQLKERRRVNT